MVTRIQPQCALTRPLCFQDHLLLETLPPFRIILHWTAGQLYELYPLTSMAAGC